MINLNTNEITETIKMIRDEHLDIRTITMGISLLDCADENPDKACQKIYDKITRCAKDLNRKYYQQEIWYPYYT